MDWSRASDVDDSHAIQEAVVTPDPAGWQAVHDGVQKREEAIGLKVASGSDSPGFTGDRSRPSRPPAVWINYRSAMAPLTMVVEVVAKLNWNKKAAQIAPMYSSSIGGSMNRPPLPTNGLLGSFKPKLNPNPKNQ